VAPPGGYLDVSSVWAAMGAIANCGWSRYTALTVQAEELLRMNETIHGEKTASEPQDRVTELIDQQAAISQVLRAIANSPHDLQPIFDAILDSATRLCRADIGALRLFEEGGFRRVAIRGDPLLVSQAWSSFPVLAEKGGYLGQLATSSLPAHIRDLTAVEDNHQGDLWIGVAKAGCRTGLFVPLLKDNEIVGTITLGRQQVQPFTDKQISLFGDFAAQATIALESTRLERQYRSSQNVLRRSIEPAAHFGHGAMSDLNPLCAQKRTSPAYVVPNAGPPGAWLSQ
jgi:transcriptional regulator with GAF, ATPase, and Fis domain